MIASLKPEDQYMFMQIKAITELKNEQSMTKKFGFMDTMFTIVLMYILVIFTGNE